MFQLLVPCTIHNEYDRVKRKGLSTSKRIIYIFSNDEKRNLHTAKNG